MFREILLNITGSVQRFFGAAKAPDMDSQVQKMLRKSNAVRRSLEDQIARLAKSDFYNDAAAKIKLERLLTDLEEWEEALQLVQARMHEELFGMAYTLLEDHLWPLTVRLSSRYQFVTGRFGDWLRDTSVLEMSMPEFENACKALRGDSETKQNAERLRKHLSTLKISELGELKFCGDCGQPMIPCEDCGALIKPCFLKMGMTHVCDSVPSKGALK